VVAEEAVSGAGAAGLSVAGLIRHLGVKGENILLCDTAGVIWVIACRTLGLSSLPGCGCSCNRIACRLTNNPLG
jgi:hypothetical protein